MSSKEKKNRQAFLSCAKYVTELMLKELLSGRLESFANGWKTYIQQRARHISNNGNIVDAKTILCYMFIWNTYYRHVFN